MLYPSLSFPLQSEQEEKIKRLCNMICSAGAETSTKLDKEKMAKVWPFLHFFLCGFVMWTFSDVGQAPVIQWLDSIYPLANDFSGG